MKDKVILVTAATKGIGYGIVEMAAKMGWEVYLGSRDAETGNVIAEGLRNSGYNVRCVYNDANDPGSYRSMVEEVINNSGRIDALVNNFGMSDPKKDLDIENTDVEVFLNTINMNLRSVFLGTQEALRYMRKEGGSIVNISSVGGIVADISQIAYGTSKAAINYLTKLIAVQEAKNNIRCNAVLPGMTATDSVEKKLTGGFREMFMKHTPLGRMAEIEEIASAVMYFAGNESRFTTGQILSVSGGFGLATPIYGDLSAVKERR